MRLVPCTRKRNRTYNSYGLSGEAGLNDGAAFPFVALALGLAAHGSVGGWVLEWAAHRLLWSVAAALVLGYALGKGVGYVAIKLRSLQRDSDAPTDSWPSPSWRSRTSPPR